MNLNGKYIGLVDISRYVVILGFFREMKPIGCMYICTCMLVGTCVCGNRQDCGGWQVSRICISKTGNPGGRGCSSTPSPKGPGTREANGVVPAWKLAAQRPRESGCFSSSSKAGKLVLWLNAVRAEDTLSYLAFLFYLGHQLIRWGSSTLERRANCFTSLISPGNTLVQESFLLFLICWGFYLFILNKKWVLNFVKYSSYIYW